MRKNIRNVAPNLFVDFRKSAIFAVVKIKVMGPVAQLNRVSDYGSEGSRFEPWRGHKYFKAASLLEVAFFV